MYCKNCGKKIPDGSGFCQHCGTNQNAVSNANRQIVGSNKSRSGIFQKKIIIGSIVGFIASAIGIVGVFFPSLLNIEKKKIQELSVIINEQKDANNLYKFLKDNENKIVQLDIKYSPKKIQNSDYRESWRENIFKKAEEKDFSNYLHKDNKYPNSKTIITYVDSDYNIRDASSNKKISEAILSSKKEEIASMSSQDPCVLTEDPEYLPNFGVLHQDIWYCHIMDIYCSQNLFYTRARYLYSLPNYPYPLMIAPTDYESYNLLYTINGSDPCKDEDIIDYDPSKIRFNESVLFGKRLSFLAQHYNSKYNDGIANIDKGSLSFVTDSSDNDIEPLYIILSRLENKDGDEDIKYKVVKAFDETGLVDIFSSPEQRVSTLDKYDPYDFITSSLLTLDSSNKIVTSNKVKDTLGGIYFGETQFSVENDSSYARYINFNPYEIAPNKSLTNSFAIEIPYSSKNNTLYTWKSDSLKKRYPEAEKNNFIFRDNNEMITLSGYFYVHAENSSELELNIKLPYFHCDLIENLSGGVVWDQQPKPCVVPKVFKLEPIGKKEIEQRNYN